MYYNYEDPKASRLFHLSDFKVSFCLLICSTFLPIIISTEMTNTSQRSDSIDIKDLQDIAPPVGVRLSGIYKRSFAYITIKDRLPIILTKVVDILSRNKEAIAQKYGQNATEEIKRIIGFISKLKNEMVTNKTLKPLPVLDDRADNDAVVWNKYLERRIETEGDIPTWFNTDWMYSECYMYRALAQEFTLLTTLHKYDPFEYQKRDAFISFLNNIELMSEYVVDIINSKSSINATEKKQHFFQLFKLNLWGNRCDLSISAGSSIRDNDDPFERVKLFNDDILVNELDFAWQLLHTKRSNETDIVDIILDNAGYELFTDLCLASFLITYGFAQKIRFYVKRYPWYVSDVTTSDFHWTLKYMSDSSNEKLRALAESSKDYIKNNVWTIEDEPYWTGPYELADMKVRDMALYAKLSEAKLIIFKGDLNYRKLVGDINWPYTTHFLEALRGFRPSNILTLRTLKADVCVGLPAGKADSLFAKDQNWMVTGQYGVIQSTILINCKCNDNIC